jgi:RNA polymerase subunit RPABC4/transcription elongation factor Spt4
MSVTPGQSGEYEVVLHAGSASVWAARLRAAAHGGRIRLTHLRRWLGTPEGRHAAVRTARVVGLAAVVVGGLVMLRRWADSARGAMAAAAGAYRAAAGAIGAAADGVRFVLSLGWLKRWLRFSAANPAAGAHRHCPDCHARIRSDARVCFRCGCRDLSPAPRSRLSRMRLVWRVLTLALYGRCPDCRRLVHAEARVCRSCGYRLAGTRARGARGVRSDPAGSTLPDQPTGAAA